MVQPKYNPQQALNKIRLMMDYSTSKTLSENKEFLSIIDDITTRDTDYIFDFVIAENNGFVIYMDNVFSKKHGFIGDLWENTWVFNEIIRENISKYSKIVGESVENDLNSILMSINWTKEFVAECIMSTGSLSSEYMINEQFWDRLKAGAKRLGSDVVQGVKTAGAAVGKGVKKLAGNIGEIGKKLLMGPILGTLRWIRRNVYTNIGMVVDVVTAMLPASALGNKIVWILIVILDIYELATGQNDPADGERNQSPYMFLVVDLISLVFSGALGLPFKKAASASLKTGAKLSKTNSKLLTTLLEKLPSVKNTLSQWGNWLSKNLPKVKNVVDYVIRMFDKVIKGVEDFIKQLLSKQGAIAVGSALAITAFFNKKRLIKLGDQGEDVGAVNEYLGGYHNDLHGYRPNCKLSDELIKGIKSSGKSFTKFTEQGVKQIESCLQKEFPANFVGPPDGKITNAELGIFTSVEMDDRGFVTKYIPHSTKEAFSNTTSAIMKGAEKLTKKAFNADETSV